MWAWVMAESAMIKMEGNAAQPGGDGVTLTPLELSAGTDQGPQQRRSHMVPDPLIPRLVSVTEAAKMLDVHRTWVWQLIREGRLPAARVGSMAVLAERTVLAFEAGADVTREGRG